MRVRIVNRTGRSSLRTRLVAFYQILIRQTVLGPHARVSSQCTVRWSLKGQFIKEFTASN